ncbi:MAG TPA: hypothetical protein VGL02_24365, partial [Streptomyces sp.]
MKPGKASPRAAMPAVRPRTSRGRAERVGALHPLCSRRTRCGDRGARADHPRLPHLAKTERKDLPVITLLPEGALQRRQLLARQTLDTAQDRLHEALLLDVARIVRDALPAATHLVLEADDHRYRRPSPFRVHLRRITGPDADLWTRDQEPAVLAGYRTAEGMTWPNVVAHVEQLLTSAIGAERGDNWWKPCRDDGDTVLLCRLPAPADIDAAQARQPQHLDAYLTADDPGSGAALWLSSPALRPTMAVAGVAITASLDADNVLTLEIDPTKTHPQLMRP